MSIRRDGPDRRPRRASLARGGEERLRRARSGSASCGGLIELGRLIAPCGPAGTRLPGEEFEIRTSAISLYTAVDFIRLAAVLADRREDDLADVLGDPASIASAS